MQSALATQGEQPFAPDDVARAFARATDAALGLADPTAAVTAALSALHESLPGSYVSLFVLEHDRLWIAMNRGYTMIPEGLPVGSGVMGRAVRTRSPELAPDVAADPDFVASVRGIVSELAVPLLVGGDVVAVLNVETTVALPATATGVEALADALAPAAQALRDARLLDVSALARLFVHLGSLRDADDIAGTVVTSLPRILPVDGAQVFVRDEEGALAELVPRGLQSRGIDLETAASLRDATDRSSIVELLELSGDGPGAVVLLPLHANGDELGMLVGWSSTARPFAHEQAELAALLAAHTAASLDAALMIRRERRSAVTDSLTSLLNRRGFESRLETELGAASAELHPLSLAVVDLDDFKQLNDRAGHAFGDALLREVGSVLARLLQPPAVAGRFGGDEFVLMFPQSGAGEAEARVEELLVRLGSELDEVGFPIGLSAGVATYPYDGAIASQLIRAADQALYSAKEHGKDRVVPFRTLGADAPDVPEAARADRNRRESAMLPEAAQSIEAIWGEPTGARVLDRLCKALTFVVGATGAIISRLEHGTLVDLFSHALREVDLGPETVYVLSDFPLTEDVIAVGRSRAISFLDPDLDSAEAHILRELGMSGAILVPLVLRGDVWGLVELYDMRLRRYTAEEQAVADLLVFQAARKLETLGDFERELGRERVRAVRRPAG